MFFPDNVRLYYFVLRLRDNIRDIGLNQCKGHALLLHSENSWLLLYKARKYIKTSMVYHDIQINLLLSVLVTISQSCVVYSTDLNECDRNANDCAQHASCTNERGSYSCKCNHGLTGDGFKCGPIITDSCSARRKYVSVSGNYRIDPDGPGGLTPFTVYCDMSDKNGVGVTVISHDSESRAHVYTGTRQRDIHYTGASLSQLASLTRVSSHCEQFIKYECWGSRLLRSAMAWWMSRDSSKMTYWGGASPGSGKCACGMTNSCADPSYGCNCDKNDNVWREDSGLLTDKTHLPVTRLYFGDVGSHEEGYRTLGKLKCYGIFNK